MTMTDKEALRIVLLLAKVTTHEATTDKWREAIARVQQLAEKKEPSR